MTNDPAADALRKAKASFPMARVVDKKNNKEYPIWVLSQKFGRLEDDVRISELKIRLEHFIAKAKSKGGNCALILDFSEAPEEFQGFALSTSAARVLLDANNALGGLLIIAGFSDYLKEAFELVELPSDAIIKFRGTVKQAANYAAARLGFNNKPGPGTGPTP